ncbi:MAG: nucleoside diphosphate kinase regulator [Cellvibrio sp.]|jgi:Transcription elongation factor
MSNQNYSLVVSSIDYQALLEIIERDDSPAAEALEAELDRADIVKAADFPRDVVAMNAAATFVDLDSGEETTVFLVYPQDADVSKKKISILSPIGTALIGLRIGDKIDWPLPNGKTRRLQVTSVTPSAK